MRLRNARKTHTCHHCGKSIEGLHWVSTAPDYDRWHMGCTPVIAKEENVVVLLGWHHRPRIAAWGLSGAISHTLGRRLDGVVKCGSHMVGKGQRMTIVYTGRLTGWGEPDITVKEVAHAE